MLVATETFFVCHHRRQHKERQAMDLAFRKTKEWLKIYDDNADIIAESVRRFADDYTPYVQSFMAATGCKAFISKLQVDELIRACSDDLYRYAEYHPVLKNKDEYLIAEPIRASYLTKWLMMFKPLILDSYSSLTSEKSFFELIEKSKIETDSIVEFFRRANEILAIYVASSALCLKIALKKDDERYYLLTEYMPDESNDEKREVRDFMYSLRYRMPHQDVYRAVYRRIDSMHQTTLA